MGLGITLAFGIVWMAALTIVFGYSHFLTSIREEKVLIEKFDKEYIHYIHKVPWRMVPGLL